jgi:hypothetical protein
MHPCIRLETPIVGACEGRGQELALPSALPEVNRLSLSCDTLGGEAARWEDDPAFRIYPSVGSSQRSLTFNLLDQLL